MISALLTLTLLLVVGFVAAAALSGCREAIRQHGRTSDEPKAGTAAAAYVVAVCVAGIALVVLIVGIGAIL